MRLGLDIGTNSIGGCLYELQDGRPVRIITLFVRIFSDGRDPQSKESLAVDRRAARASRRRRDRYLRRRASLMRKLAEAGLMPADPSERKALEALDPYELRARGLDEPLNLNELGRALFHLNQRRGFKSNRKTDRGDNEAGKIALATARLDQAMMVAGARTYGEFLHKRRQSADDPRQTPTVRARLTSRPLEDGKTDTGYDFYASRHHLEDEFNALWTVQASHHAALTDALRNALYETIFFQRPLKAPEIGRCLYEDEKRLAKAHPLFQRRVLFETVNQLRIREPGQPDRPLTREERDRLILAIDGHSAKAMTSANLSFHKLGQTIGLKPDQSFSLQTEARKGIACDALRAIMTHEERYGPLWTALDVEGQWGLIQRVQSVESNADFDALLDWLQTDHNLDRDQAIKVANAPLPQGYGRIGLTATQKILSILEAEVVTYAEAAARAYGHHSDFRTGEVLDALPYYGVILDRHVIPGSNNPEDDDVTRYGRITNPTVHIGLGQLRRLVNQIIDVYGKPDEIVVELARDLKLGEKQKLEVQRTIRKNTEAALQRGKKLTEIGVKDTGANRLMLRLWEELGQDPLDRRCPYSGEQISPTRLFSGACDIDHILPYSRTLDDSIANRIVCLARMNKQKRNKSPWEAWGGTDHWPTVATQIKRLAPNKQWRFAADAMERFEDERGFLDRQLVDTQYLSRIAREYLSRLYPERGRSHVWVVPGKMTEMLRRHWGLNDLLSDADGAAKAKNRTDHRHHAIDAAVIGATDRSLLQRIQRASAQREDQGLGEVIGNIDPPWEGFRDDLAAQLDRMTVSHRADHGRIDASARRRGRDSTTGQLHNDTAYGLTSETSATGAPLVVTRKPLIDLKPGDLPKIRDEQLKDILLTETYGLEGKDFTSALTAFARKPTLNGRDNPYRGIRRVRLIQAQKLVEIRDKEGRAYKGYKGDSNHCFEIWEMPDGKWARVVYTTFEAHQKGVDKRPHPAARKLMRLHKKDMIALNHPKHGPGVRVIQKFDDANLYLAPHLTADADRRHRDPNDPFKFIKIGVSILQKAGARRVIVDEIGRIRDPGPPQTWRAKDPP
ncbi:MAG: type II CRISPR RNA-guided endonuclease Cas9 [Maricaulaceae bacterium]